MISTKLKTIEYNRSIAFEYAYKWALSRNPRYYNFEKIGGDCTNFASQVVFSGSGIMNYSLNIGWYYSNPLERAPSWTAVDLFYEFMVNNKSVGPYAEQIDVSDVKVGDIVQLSFDEGGTTFHHSLIVVKTGFPSNVDNIFINAHTYDKMNYPLKNYNYNKDRYIHILGCRKTN